MILEYTSGAVPRAICVHTSLENLNRVCRMPRPGVSLRSGRDKQKQSPLSSVYVSPDNSPSYTVGYIFYFYFIPPFSLVQTCSAEPIFSFILFLSFLTFNKCGTLPLFILVLFNSFFGTEKMEKSSLKGDSSTPESSNNMAMEQFCYSRLFDTRPTSRVPVSATL